MLALLSCTRCAFQQVVDDERELADLKTRHEAQTGHAVEVQT